MSDGHGARTSHPIVPDDFDLAAARNRKTTTPDDEQPRCPHCETVNISHKSGHYFGSAHRKDGEWRCNYVECGRHFNEPVWGDGNE